MNDDQIKALLGLAINEGGLKKGLSGIYGILTDSLADMATNVYEIDNAMTDLYKVTNETSKVYDEFLTNSSSKAKELGVSISNVISQSSKWAKLGFSLDKSSKLSEYSSIYSNLSGVDDETAVKDIAAAMKAFNISADESIRIIDIYNKLGNEFSLSASSMGEAVRNSAAALSSQGNTLEQTAAMLAGAGKNAESFSEFADSLGIASLRVSAMKDSLRELGESYADVGSVAGNQTQIYNLTQGQVNILDEQNNQLKETYSILGEVASVWSTLSSSNQDKLLDLIFGEGSQTQGYAIISAFQSGEIQSAYEAAANSAGSAMASQETHLDNLQGKVQQFNAAFQSLSSKFMSSDFLKGFVDTGTGVISVLDKIIDKTDAFPALISAIGGALTFKNIGRADLSCPSIKYADAYMRSFGYKSFHVRHDEIHHVKPVWN